MKHHLKKLKKKAIKVGIAIDHIKTPFGWGDLLWVSFGSALVALVIKSLI